MTRFTLFSVLFFSFSAFAQRAVSISPQYNTTGNVNGWSLVGKPGSSGGCGMIPVKNVSPKRPEAQNNISSCVQYCGRGKGVCNETNVIMTKYPHVKVQKEIFLYDRGVNSSVTWVGEDVVSGTGPGSAYCHENPTAGSCQGK